jgi:hypothetical protein
MFNLDAKTRLHVEFDPVLRNYFAHLWHDGQPVDRLGLVERLLHVDDLMDAIPDLLERNGIRALTDKEHLAAGEAAIRAKDGPRRRTT